MSTQPEQGYGDWKPGRRKGRSLGAFLGGLASVVATLLIHNVVTHDEPAPTLPEPASHVTVDTRKPSVVLESLGDMPAAVKLRELRIRPRKEAPDYDRSYFGEPWADVDNNGCDTRNDVLARDLEQVNYRKGSHCVVSSGVLHDPYVGETIHYQRGPETSPLVQIDHVVALGDAWRSGAFKWTPAQRQDFANDPNNLMAVQGQANQDKESSRADQWMPPREDFWCEYVTRQIEVKHDWDLSVAPQERDAMIRALSTCK